MLASDGSDEDWVRRAQAGDQEAFSELVRRHQSPVYRYLLRMLGSREDALVLTQDAFVKAWQALPHRQHEAQVCRRSSTRWSPWAACAEEKTGSRSSRNRMVAK